MKLNEYLHLNSLGLNEFARRIGVDPATVHRIKNGTVTPHRRTMALIHKATSGAVCPNDLMQLFPPDEQPSAGFHNGTE